MANAPITSLPSAGALAGTEPIALVQSGATKQATVQAVADLAPAFDIDTLPAAGAVSGTDPIALTQSGAMVQATVQAVADLAPAFDIDTLPAAGALAGADPVAVTQSGTMYQTTVQAIANLAPLPSDFAGGAIYDFAGSVATVSGTTLTLNAANAATYMGRMLLFTNAAGCTVSLAADLPAGWSISWKQASTAGTIAFNGSVVPENRQGHLHSAGAKSVGTVACWAVGVPTLAGDTAA